MTDRLLTGLTSGGVSPGLARSEDDIPRLGPAGGREEGREGGKKGGRESNKYLAQAVRDPGCGLAAPLGLTFAGDEERECQH